MNFLAFDLGASSGKMFLAESGSSITLKKVHEFPNEACKINEGLYWDIIRIYQELLCGVLKAKELTNDNIYCLGLDSFCNDFGLIDKSGALMSPVRCYRDARTERHKESIYAKMSPKRLHELSGNQIAPFNTLMHLAAMREDGQGYLLENCDKLLFVPDLLIRFLTGRAVSEYTVASVSQAYSFRKAAWEDEIIGAFSLPKHMFGEIVPPGTLVGRTTGAINAQLNTKGFNVAAVCEHDTASAFVGSGAPINSAIISSGTWALVGILVDGPIINDETFAYNIANEGGLPHRHRMIRNVMGTWLLQELKRDYSRLGQSISYAELETHARRAQPFKYLIDVDEEPFFAPGDMIRKIRQSCAKRYGSAPEGPGELARCIYEGLALKYRWAIEKLELATQTEAREVTIVGGGVKDALMCQFTASACNRPVTAGASEATAIGNICVQMLATGTVASIEEAQARMAQACSPTRYEPRDIREWDAQYQKFRKLFNC